MNNQEWLKIKEVFHQALALPEEERANLLESQESFIRAEVKGLLASHRKSEGFIAEPALDELGFNEKSLVGTNINGYKILKLIGKGGMGVVFLAEKEGLAKKVALKVIKRGMDTEAVLHRFYLERQILSRLEHENIARLFDGGTTEDGLPFFVMEYVEGLCVTEFCARNNLSIESRLELFQKICAAVHYAHQNLVVHRDLKPSNILITKDGVPKLLDFGIAKLLGSENTEETATQARMFTPEYASPEQINSLPIATTSDIYSLGVILYELLSGQRPFKSAQHGYQEIVRMILTEEPPKPSSVVGSSNFVSGEDETLPFGQNTKKTRGTTKQTAFQQTKNVQAKSLKGDLDNIILKSLRKEPSRRYQSALEFAEDINRHLRGLPVSATADTFVYRFSKFVRRHRNEVVAGALVSALLLIFSGIALRQAFIADRERQKAENRFEQVRKLANLVIFDYHDRIAKLPGATSAREKMLNDSLEFLDNLAQESDDRLDLRREIVKAYKKVGDIQGAPDTGNTGQTQAALESYQKAYGLQESVIAADPDNVSDKIILGELGLEIGLALRDVGEAERAGKHFQNSLEIFSALLQNTPNDIKLRSVLAKTFWNVANLQTAEQNFDVSLENYAKSVELYRQLALDDSSTPRHSRNEALTYKNMSSILQLRGENEKALEYLQKALAIDAKRAEADREDVSAQLDLSFTYGTIAASLRGRADTAGALANYRQALAIRESVFRADAKNVFAESAVARAYQEIGRTLLMTNQTAEAVQNISKANAIFQKLAETDAENLEKKATLADSLALYAYAEGLGGNLRKSTDIYRRSFAIYEDLAAKNKLSSLNQTRFAAAYAKFGEVLVKNQKYAEAAPLFEKARELFEKEAVRTDAAENLAVVYEYIADTKLKLKSKLDEAKDFYRKSLEMWDERRKNGRISEEFLKKPEEVRRKLAQI